MTLLYVTARLNRSSDAKPPAVIIIIPGITISANAVKSRSESISKDKASLANLSATSLLLSRFENIGRNAVLNAPSAKSRLNILGMEKAIKNDSAIIPDPKKLAISISLKKPKKRLTRVHDPTIEKLFSNNRFANNLDFIAWLFWHQYR